MHINGSAHSPAVSSHWRNDADSPPLVRSPTRSQDLAHVHRARRCTRGPSATGAPRATNRGITGRRPESHGHLCVNHIPGASRHHTGLDTAAQPSRPASSALTTPHSARHGGTGRSCPRRTHRVYGVRARPVPCRLATSRTRPCQSDEVARQAPGRHMVDEVARPTCDLTTQGATSRATVRPRHPRAGHQRRPPGHHRRGLNTGFRPAPSPWPTAGHASLVDGTGRGRRAAGGHGARELSSASPGGDGRRPPSPGGDATTWRPRPRGVRRCPAASRG
ncbi:Uncharacterised protein [Actinomyces howellii]|uniref:Uncharacterized protein n=1 Tax=Actinomyces howellii TaxID=52771 RepID=A0A448HH81_9ACTO|nr:Uncharacterised protein [Actinomyces howellii]